MINLILRKIQLAKLLIFFFIDELVWWIVVAQAHGVADLLYIEDIVTKILSRLVVYIHYAANCIAHLCAQLICFFFFRAVS